jgi:hypothetical protein
MFVMNKGLFINYRVYPIEVNNKYEGETVG